MKGERRNVPREELHNLKAGEYAWDELAQRWWLSPPDGILTSISPNIHTVTEHEDGTITVSPSIMRYGAGDLPAWHGYLERGVWRTV